MEKITTVRYKAFDGSSFNTEKECIEYENNLNISLNELLADLYIPYLDNAPITLEFSYMDLVLLSSRKNKDFQYQWFKLNNQDDYKRLKECINEHRNMSHLNQRIKPPTIYPNLICIELSQNKKIYSPENNYTYTGKYIYYSDEREKLCDYISTINNVYDFL